jgi:hypothetical protein
MSATLWRSEIGTEGYAPGTLLLQDTVANFAAITAAGYLNTIAAASSVQPRSTDILFAAYNGGVGVFTLSFSGSGVITLVASESTVIVPTIANHIATYTNTSGTLSEDPTIAISGGSIQAGLSGTAGTLISYPATATKGHLAIAAVANTGNSVTTISNDAMGQASTVNIPDPANAIGQLLIGATATPFVSGNFPQNSGTAGLMVDSGVPVADIMQLNVTNTLTAAGSIVAHKVNGTELTNAVTASGMSGVITTSSLSTAGGASYAITWTNTFISATSTVLLSIQGGTNTTENITLKVAPGSGSATLTIYNNTAATALNGTIFIGYLVI